MERITRELQRRMSCIWTQNCFRWREKGLVWNSLTFECKPELYIHVLVNLHYSSGWGSTWAIISIGDVETTCRLVSLVSLPSCSVEDEVAWSPHAASFPLLPAVSNSRSVTPPRFLSFLRRRRWSGMKPTRRLVSLPSRSVNLVSFLIMYR